MVTRVKITNPEISKYPGLTRAGKGKPLGSKNKRTLIMENILKHASEGELPHEFLLRVARGDKIIQLTPTGDLGYFIPTKEERIDCAKAAAPYFAPRLSATEVVRSIPDEELLELIVGFAATAGYSLTDLGIPRPDGTPEEHRDGDCRENEAGVFEQVQE